MIPKYNTGDRVVITEGVHKGKQAVVCNVSVSETAIHYLVDGVSKNLRLYLGSQLEPAPPKPPITDPLSLQFSDMLLAPYRARKAAEAGVE
jgi:ribosomal protein L24